MTGGTETAAMTVPASLATHLGLPLAHQDRSAKTPAQQSVAADELVALPPRLRFTVPTAHGHLIARLAKHSTEATAWLRVGRVKSQSSYGFWDLGFRDWPACWRIDIEGVARALRWPLLGRRAACGAVELVALEGTVGRFFRGRQAGPETAF